MGGSGKKRVQSKAESRAQQTTAREDVRAQEMHKDVQSRRGAITGQQEDIRPAVTQGALNFAKTGGFEPGEKEQFLRRATGVVPAFYARAKDALNRRLSIQGGYMPGFTSSQARLTRQGAQAGAEASLAGNVAFSRERRSGQLAGLSQLSNLLGMSVDELASMDRTTLANRALAAGVSQSEVNQLLSLSGQKRGRLETIRDVSGLVEGPARGVAGLLTAGGG